METPAEIHSRFRVVGAPVDAPGHCGVCGSANSSDRDFIEFGLKTSYNTGDPYRPVGNGKLYLCTFCVGEAAQRLGIGETDSETVPLEDYNALEEKYELTKQLVDGDFLDHWRSNIEPAITVLADILCDRDGAVLEVASEDSGAADSAPVKSGKHNRKQGPTDLPSTTDSTDFSL